MTSTRKAQVRPLPPADDLDGLMAWLASGGYGTKPKGGAPIAVPHSDMSGANAAHLTLWEDEIEGVVMAHVVGMTFVANMTGTDEATVTDVRVKPVGDEPLRLADVNLGNAEAFLDIQVNNLRAGVLSDAVEELLAPWRVKGARRSNADHARLAVAYEILTVTEPKKPAAALARLLGTSTSVATNRVGLARRLGYLEPVTQGQTFVKATPAAHQAIEDDEATS